MSGSDCEKAKGGRSGEEREARRFAAMPTERTMPGGADLHASSAGYRQHRMPQQRRDHAPHTAFPVIHAS